MKNFLIDENEKNEILKKHKELKNSLTETVLDRIKTVENFRATLSEQSEPIFIDTRTANQAMKDCVTDPSVKANLYVFKGKPAIKVNGGPDNIRIYTNEPNQNFGGYNWYVLNTAETKILKGPYTWSCQAKPGPNPNQTDIDNLIKSGVWVKKEDLVKQGMSQDEIASNYQPHPKYNFLYKRQVNGPSKTNTFTTDQQSFVDAWSKQNPEAGKNLETEVYKTNPSAADFASGRWTKDNYFIAAGSEPYFPADDKGVKGLKIYFDLSKLGENTRENCRAQIKDFVDKYRKHLGGEEPNAQEFATQKAFVKRCKYTHKFGGPLSQIDDYLRLLSGETYDGTKGPSRYDSDGQPNKWLIN
jgi:hypothetical protein